MFACDVSGHLSSLVLRPWLPLLKFAFQFYARAAKPKKGTKVEELVKSFRSSWSRREATFVYLPRKFSYPELEAICISDGAGVASFRQEFINCPPDMITYGIETGYRKQLTHFAGCHGMRSD